METDTGVKNFNKVKMNEKIIYNEFGKKTHKIENEWKVKQHDCLLTTKHIAKMKIIV